MKREDEYKKKLVLAVTAVLCLLLATAALAAELPAAGDQMNGFTVKEVRDFPLIDATIVRFEHDKTGAEVFYIANDDNNRVFDMVFRTRAVDNTGLPHVFEHTTLSGSDKYPSTELFFNLSLQTYNTYMNASTFDIMTSYPVASLSEAQLLKLADYYCDSCLHPIVLERESIYRTEAWRYRLEKPEDEMTLEGTVYSEMLGANTIERAARSNAYRAAFPGSTIGNNQGGENDAIPDMTWQMLKDYHNTYYVPSNSVTYLYGNIEDYSAFLALLDEAFAPYDRVETDLTDAGYTPITEPVTSSAAYAMEEGSNTSRISSVYYIVVCPDLAAEDYVSFDMVTSLLDSDSSPLMTALKDAIPYGAFDCSIDIATPDPCIVFIADNVDPEDAETFRSVVDEQLAAIAKTGFSDEQIDAELASLAIDTRLVRESAAVGVESIIPSFAYYYMCSDDPWYYMGYVDEIDQIAAKNANGVYANLISENIVGNTRNVLVTTYGEPGLKEKQQAELAAHLA